MSKKDQCGQLLTMVSLVFCIMLYCTSNANAQYGGWSQQSNFRAHQTHAMSFNKNNFAQIKQAQYSHNNQGSSQGQYIGRESSSTPNTFYPKSNTGSSSKTKTEDPNWQREREEVKVQFQQFKEERHRVDNDMATNDKQKEDANNTHDNLERLRVYLALIDKSKHAADLLASVSNNIENWNSHYNYEWDANDVRNKRDEYRNYQKAREQDIQAIKKDIYKQLKKFDKKKDLYDLTIANADASNDLHQRLETRRKIIPKLRKAADYAHKFTTIANEDHDRMRRLREEQHKRERELPAIEYDILDKELGRMDSDMGMNEAQIKAADETQDDFERLSVYLNVIQKSKYSADQAEAFTSNVENWNNAYDSKLDANKVRNKRDEYRNYLLAKKRDILVIKNNIYAQLKQFDKDQEFYNLAIADADASNDFNKRLEIRREIIPKLKAAADYSHRFTTLADEDHDRMRRLRNAQRTIKRQLPGIETELKEEQARNAECAHQLKAEQEQIRLEEEQELAFEREGGEYLDLDANGNQIAWELRNFEAMFNGQIAPDMDSFDNMMGAFLGEGTFVENGQLLSDFDPSMAGDYAIGSYQYRDEKFDVSIDIRRMAKFIDGGQDFDMFGTESMNLRGIRMVSDTEEITFALYGGGEKILIKSDLDSMGNYVAQKTIEGKVYLRTNPEKMLDVDVDKIEIWGVDKKDTNKFRAIASTIADFIPYVGTGKAISELSLGYDYIGGEKVSRVVAVCGIVGTLIPVPGAGKAMKFAGKTVTKIIGNAPDLMKKMKQFPTKYHTRASAETAVLRKEFERTIRKKFIKEYASSEEAVKRFTVMERAMMKNGEMPKDWMIHHKHPLFKGGNNDFSNLRVMKKLIHNTYRKRFHYYEKGKNIYGLD